MFFLGVISYQRQGINIQTSRRLPFFSWDVILAVSCFAIISGVRFNVGVDYLSYLDYYLTYQRYGYFTINMEYFFQLLTIFLSSLDMHFSFFFGIIALFQIVVFYKSFQDERFLYPFFGLIIVLGPHYLIWMNGVRQILAATIFVYSIRFILDRDLFKYFLFILIASQFHQSALMLLPLYFFPNKDIFKSRLITSSLIIGSLVVSMFFGVSSILLLFTPIIDFIGYHSISFHIEKLVEIEDIKAWGPRNLILLLSNILLVLYSPYLKSYFSSKKFMICYNFTILGFVFGNLLMNSHNIFQRPVMYFNIFSIATFSYFYYFLFKNSKKHSIVFFIFVFLNLSYLPITLIADFGKGTEDYSNYKTFFEQNDLFFIK